MLRRSLSARATEMREPFLNGAQPHTSVLEFVLTMIDVQRPWTSKDLKLPSGLTAIIPWCELEA